MSLLNSLPKHKAKAGISGQEQPAGQVTSSPVTPADYSSPPAAPSNSKPSLADRLKAKSPIMAPEAGLQQPAPKPNHPGVIPASEAQAVVASGATSLASKLRQQIQEKQEQTRAQSPSAPDTPTQSDTHPPPPTGQTETPIQIAGESQNTLKAKIAKMKRAEIAIEESFEPSPLSSESDLVELKDRYGNPIQLNDKQKQAVDMALSGQSFVLTGEAGTGKSTTIEAVLLSLLHHHREKITDVDYRMQDRSGRRVTGPSCCVCSYTRKAIGNVARILSHNFGLYSEMEGALQTVHNLLEYSPVIQWSEKQEREVQVFKPTRGKWAPLDVTHLVIEEASMLGLDLWAELRDALQEGVQIIYVGDINQLPPVFGKSVMSYALTKLPIVHLDIVYRQALDNPIIAAAHNVLHGSMFKEVKPAIKWLQGKSKMAQPEETMSRAMGKFFEAAIENKETVDRWQDELTAWESSSLEQRASLPKPKTKEQIDKEAHSKYLYNPDEDIVLIPFNKNAMGTKQINYRIAQILGEKRQAEVFEIIAGFEKHYLAIGDKVLFNKMEGTIISIRANMNYMGRKPMKPSVNLSRFGFYIGTAADAAAAVLNGEDDFEGVEELDLASSIDENEERRQAASHNVSIELETGQEVTINSAGEFNGQVFQLGYALSVHKSQGSEWRRVFLLFHKNHAPMLSRELLYTAMTRAREELVIVSRPELIRRGISNPRIKGNSLQEKLEFFNSGYLDEDIEVTV